MHRPPRIKEKSSKVFNLQGHSINVDNVIVLYSFSSICENGRGGARKWKKQKLRHSKLTGVLRCYHENYYNSYVLDYLVKKMWLVVMKTITCFYLCQLYQRITYFFFIFIWYFLHLLVVQIQKLVLFLLELLLFFAFSNRKETQ